MVEAAHPSHRQRGATDVSDWLPQAGIASYVQQVHERLKRRPRSQSHSSEKHRDKGRKDSKPVENGTFMTSHTRFAPLSGHSMALT